MTETTQAARVIAAFGGRAQMERDTKFSYTVINRWWRTGFVPSEHHQYLIDQSYAKGTGLLVTDLYAHLVEPRSRGMQSAAA
jgi:hypothetical protein